MKGVLDALYKRLLLAAHPVGSIYQSTVATPPDELFGGTWEPIKDVFLLAEGARKAGSTGGEAEHTLIETEMPKHVHRIAKGTQNDNASYINNVYTAYQSEASITEGKYWTASTLSTGGSGPHNNMPPYLAIYMWKRTV